MTNMLGLLPFVMGASLGTQSSDLPKGAIVLFDGKDASAWVQNSNRAPCEWDVKDGCLIVKAGKSEIVTKQQFGDYRLHLEFWLPLMADQKDQGRANSGVYNQGRYEIQILDMYKNTTYQYGGCGAIYGQKDPDMDAIKPPEEWNSYDILFKAPRFDKAGKLTAKPRITVFHNGLRIHNDVEIDKESTAGVPTGPRPARGPILLQNHGALVRFRNIWIVPLS